MSNKKSVNAEFHHMQGISFDKEMLEVGLFQLFYNLGMNLINLSLIFYMYTDLEYKVWQIFIFYFFWQLAFSFIQPFVGVIIEKLGLKHSMSLRSISAIVLFLPMPYLMSVDYWQTLMYLCPLFLIRAIGYGSSSVAYDIFLTHHMNKSSKGSMLAWIQIAIMMGGVIAPLLGAFIMKYLDFTFLTYVGVICFLLSSFVLYLTPDEKVNVPYSAKKLLNDTRATSKFLFFSEFGRVFFDAILWIVWPVFLILVLSDIVSLGVLISISSGVSMLLAYFVGRMIDKQGKDSAILLKYGAYRSTVLNFFRAFWFDPMILSIIDTLNKLNNQTIKIPYDVEFYKWMHEGNTLEKSHIRRVISENIYMASFLVLGGVFYYFEEAPTWIFVIIFALGALSLTLLSGISKIQKIKK